MKQKKLVLTVYGEDSEVRFSSDPASPEQIMSALTLFNEIGTEICIAIREVEVPAQS